MGLVGLPRASLELRVVRIGLDRLDRQVPCAPEQTRTGSSRPGNGGTSREDPVQQRQKEKQRGSAGDHDRADPLEAAGEMLEHLEEAQEEPLGPGRIIGARRDPPARPGRSALDHDHDRHGAEDGRDERHVLERLAGQ